MLLRCEVDGVEECDQLENLVDKLEEKLYDSAEGSNLKYYQSGKKLVKEKIVEIKTVTKKRLENL